MHLMETFTFGQMLYHLRKQTNRSEDEMATLLDVTHRFDRSSPNWLSQWERDAPQRKRPPLDLVRRFGAVYGLEAKSILFSYLLRSSDYPATQEDVADQRVRLDRQLSNLPDPACVLDFHYRFITGNSLFAQLCNLAPPAFADTLEIPSAPRGAPHIADPSIISPHSLTRQDQQEGEIALSVGQPFLELIFSRRSPLRTNVEPAEWRKLARFFVARFWLTTTPLIRPGWYEQPDPQHEGEPPWLVELQHTIESLPDQAGTDFRQESDIVRDRLRNDPRNAVELITDFMPDTVVYWHGSRTKFLVHTHDLRDGRFVLYQFTPTEGTQVIG